MLLMLALLAGAALAAGCQDDDDDTEAENLRLVSKYLYVSNSGDDTIMGFKINASTGALTELADSPWTAGNAPSDMCTNAGGEFIFVTNSLTNDISAFEVDPADGALTEVSGSPFTTGTNPGRCQVDSNGEHLYHLANGTSIHVIDIESNGALTEIQEKTAGGNLLAAALNPGDTFFVTGDATTADLYTYFVIPSGGGLANVSGSPFMAGGSPHSAVFSANSEFLYVTDDGSGRAYGFSQDPDTGALTATPGSPYAVGTTTTVMTTDAESKHLYISDDTAIFVYGIGADGALSAAGSVTTADRSQALVLNAKGNYLYKTSDQDNELRVYKRNTTSGALTETSGSPVPAGTAPWGAVVVSVYQ